MWRVEIASPRGETGTGASSSSSRPGPRRANLRRGTALSGEGLRGGAAGRTSTARRSPCCLLGLAGAGHVALGGAVESAVVVGLKCRERTYSVSIDPASCELRLTAPTSATDPTQRRAAVSCA